MIGTDKLLEGPRQLLLGFLESVDEAGCSEYEGILLYLRPEDLAPLREAVREAYPAGWQGRMLDSIALTLMWADLSVLGPLDSLDEERRGQTLADLSALVGELPASLTAALTEAQAAPDADAIDRTWQRIHSLEEAIQCAAAQPLGPDELPDVPGEPELPEASEVLDLRDSPEPPELPEPSEQANSPAESESVEALDSDIVWFAWQDKARPASPSVRRPPEKPDKRGAGRERWKQRQGKGSRNHSAKDGVPPGRHYSVQASGEGVFAVPAVGSASRQAIRRAVILFAFLAGASVLTMHLGREIRAKDVTIVRPITAATIARELPSATIIDTNQHLAFALIEVGREWESWNGDERLARSTAVMVTLGAKGYERVDLVLAGTRVVHWEGGALEL